MPFDRVLAFYLMRCETTCGTNAQHGEGFSSSEIGLFKLNFKYILVFYSKT
jgi:hypothetical protein